MLEIPSGDEFTSSDLAHMVHSTVSRSLEDDLKESAYSRYHKRIGKVQQEERKKLLETAQLICDDANKIVNGKNKQQVEEIRSHAQWVFDEEKKMYRKRIDDATKAEKEKLALLLTNIEAYARSAVPSPAWWFGNDERR